MKILYINNFLESTGYAEAGRGMILALDAAGIDVVPQSLSFGATQIEVPKRILELWNKSSKGCDTVIYHTLPEFIEYDGHFKNICLFASETDRICSQWVDKLNLMDEVWVINNQSRIACLLSGVKPQINVIRHAFDTDKYSKNFQKLDQLKQYTNGDDFIFYTIGELTKRKNFAALIKAFHLEFDPDESVQLVIKVNKPGKSKEEVFAYANDFCGKVKEGLKIRRKYKEEIVISDHLSERQISQLHVSCDCFISPSYGESFCIPAWESMAFGKTPIVTDCTGFREWCDNLVGWLVPANVESCFGETKSLNYLYSANEKWWNIKVDDLRKAMREAFEKRGSLLRKEKSERGKKRANFYSYQNVGSILKDVLNGKKKSYPESIL